MESVLISTGLKSKLKSPKSAFIPPQSIAISISRISTTTPGWESGVLIFGNPGHERSLAICLWMNVLGQGCQILHHLMLMDAKHQIAFQPGRSIQLKAVDPASIS
jgi:signal recognition particle receptor subunit beta